ncbi:hypothetical protein M0R72_21710 [Candidatus Pacearchaeota archaeon]|jgi:ATP-dependent DNA ligase|nr:hypothetical protein [Candidatus Pacearchaeota archaeon]
MSATWNDGPFKKAVVKRGMDGLEEFALTVWKPQAQRDCPVGVYPAGSGKSGGTMRNSLGYERDDSNKVVYVGGGGAATDYIFVQEKDRSLHHTTGKAGFINDTLQSNISKLPTYIKKHI